MELNCAEGLVLASGETIVGRHCLFCLVWWITACVASERGEGDGFVTTTLRWSRGMEARGRAQEREREREDRASLYIHTYTHAHTSSRRVELSGERERGDETDLTDLTKHASNYIDQRFISSCKANTIIQPPVWHLAACHHSH